MKPKSLILLEFKPSTRISDTNVLLRVSVILLRTIIFYVIIILYPIYTIVYGNTKISWTNIKKKTKSLIKAHTICQLRRSYGKYYIIYVWNVCRRFMCLLMNMVISPSRSVQWLPVSITVNHRQARRNSTTSMVGPWKGVKSTRERK